MTTTREFYYQLIFTEFKEIS